MEEGKLVYRLITNRRAAVVSIALTGFVAATTFRNVFFRSPRDHHAHWLFPVDWILPRWASLPVNIVFYAYLLWLCIVFFRAAKGRERVMVAGWCPGLLLGPFKNAFSLSVTDAIQFFEVVGMTIALVESVLIFREYSGLNDTPPGSTFSDTVEESREGPSDTSG